MWTSFSVFFKVYFTAVKSMSVFIEHMIWFNIEHFYKTNESMLKICNNCKQNL